MQTKSWRSFTQIKGIYANRTDYTEIRVRAVEYSSGKEEKRKQSEETDKDKETQNSGR